MTSPWLWAAAIALGGLLVVLALLSTGIPQAIHEAVSHNATVEDVGP